MLIANRTGRVFSDDEFANFPSCLNRGDVLVLNNTKVFPARLFGRSETGASVEIFLIEKLSDSVWRALARRGDVIQRAGAIPKPAPKRLQAITQ